MNSRLQFLLESLRKLLRRNAISRVKKVLNKSRNEDVASVMRYLDDSQRHQVFDLLSTDEDRSETLAELDENLFVEVVTARPVENMAQIISLMSVDDQTNLLSHLPEDLKVEILSLLNPEDVAELKEMLDYDRETAAGIMSTEFFSLSENSTCAEAINELQHAQDVEMAFYIYVVDFHDKLTGVVSLRALLMNPPSTPLIEIKTQDTIYVKQDQDQEEVAQLAARYNLLAIPVVDDKSHLLGIVTIDDVIDVIREEATEDILKMAGADETAYEDTSAWSNFRTRAPWLFATWIGGLAASILIGLYEDQLQKQVALAAFIPIVLGMGGNVGSQTATIIVRGLATGHVKYGLGAKYLVRELTIGGMLGVFYGVLLALYSAVRYHEHQPVALALTVGLSIWVSMFTAAIVGASTPLFFHRLKIDPAIATGPLVTTAVDVLGILVYFLCAQWFMDI
jgi:magnesium transporter